MASEREAARAFEAHAEELRALGARYVVVAKVGKGRRKTCGLVVAFDHRPSRHTPKTLDVFVSNKAVAVPVVAMTVDEFRSYASQTD